MLLWLCNQDTALHIPPDGMLYNLKFMIPIPSRKPNRQQQEPATTTHKKKNVSTEISFYYKGSKDHWLYLFHSVTIDHRGHLK